MDIAAIAALAPVVPVLTIERAADAVPLARALAKGGLPVLEITLRTAAALEALKAIAAEVPDAVAQELCWNRPSSTAFGRRAHVLPSVQGARPHLSQRPGPQDCHSCPLSRRYRRR
jgi:KDPG and KHG aldolase